VRGDVDPGSSSRKRPPGARDWGVGENTHKLKTEVVRKKATYFLYHSVCRLTNRSEGNGQEKPGKKVRLREKEF